MAAQSPSRNASAEAVLRRVELRVARRLDGLLQGERRGRRPGPGGEPTLTRAYEEGDDVRWVDWPLSARVGTPMVRVPEIEPVLTAWALVDRSPSMAFGTVEQTKDALAREVLAGLGVVMRRRGDRLGMVATRSGDLDLVRQPRADRRGLIAAIAAVDAVPPAPEGSGRTDLVPRAARWGGSPTTAARSSCSPTSRCSPAWSAPSAASAGGTTSSPSSCATAASARSRASAPSSCATSRPGAAA